MLRSLRYYWKMNVAVGVGAAVATATLTGALVVGDSVRGSLRDLTLDRLGLIDYALVSDRFFSEQIAAAIDDAGVAPAILLSGAAVHGSTSRRASVVQIVGVDKRFWAMYEDGVDAAAAALATASSTFPAVVLNASLAEELAAGIGDDLLLTFQQMSDVPRESLFGRKGTADVVRTLRVTVSGLIVDSGAGRFRLQSHQGTGHNAYLALKALQDALKRPGRVNGLLATRRDREPDINGAELLQSTFDSAVELDDLELELLPRNSSSLELLSARFILSERTLAAALAAARTVGAPVLPVLTYLANSLTAANGRSVPYSTVSALDMSALQRSPSPFGGLSLTDSSPAPLLNPREILVNEWAAADLEVNAGDSLSVSYYEVGPGEQLLTRTTPMRVAGVVRLAGLGADRTLTPAYPGIQEAGDMSSWSAPFPVDYERIRKRDEQYWDEYGATPKAFVSQAAGLRLWSSRFGNTTSIRFAAATGMSLQQTGTLLERELRNELQPAQLGLTFQPVKAQALQAAAGATDFSGLFIGFSMFLIAAAALLTGLLFRLGVEQRAREIGLLVALGFTRSSTRRRMLGEAAIVAGAGGLLGVAGAWGYGWLMMAGLRTWWQQAVGTTALYLHAEPLTMLTGFAASLLIVFMAIRQAHRRLLQMPARSLVAGEIATSATHAPGRTRLAAIIALLLAATAITAASMGGGDSTTTVILFFVGGGLLLVSGLSAFSHWLRRQPRRSAACPPTPLSVSAGNSRRQPGRSLLSATLVASACFVIVAAGANRKVSEDDGVDGGGDRAGGSGGFSLVAQAEIPIHQDLNSDSGRFELGLGNSVGSTLAGARVFSFRLLPGEDASCLNLYKPQQPTVLGASAEFVARGGFRFKSVVGERIANPWELLERGLGPGVIPVIGDYNSVLWILHLGLGDELVVRDEAGADLRMRFVGLLDGSLFQSEIIISERNFLHHFPSTSGFGFFAIEAPPPVTADVAATLESGLSRYGFDSQYTAVRLQRFADVENTYLSTFQTLGGLGLFLGTIGLGVVLLRNVLERTGELATLRAVGFQRSLLSRMLVTESAFLLVVGIVIGTVAALVAVAPHLIDVGGRIPALSLGATLAVVVAVGVGASTAAAALALRAQLLPTLKAE